jgi:hypothetical protein
MKKKRSVVQSIRSNRLAPRERSWHNGGDIELHLYGRSLRRAAKTLIASLETTPGSVIGWDAAPVILLYRQNMELHLKELVGEGSSLLPNPIDPLTLYKTHSLRWLAQIASQIIKAACWEGKFKCEGVADLAAFSTLVEEIETADPIVSAVMSIDRNRDGSVPAFLTPANVVRLSRILDALLDLLGATTDALAALLDQKKFCEYPVFSVRRSDNAYSRDRHNRCHQHAHRPGG